MIGVCMIVNKPYYYDPRVRRYAEALADAGARVDILCVRDQSRPSGEQVNGVRVFTIPMGRATGGIGRYLLQYVAHLFLFTVWLLPLYIRNRYQIIHVHNMPDFLVFAALLPRILGAKVILDVHDPMPEFYLTKFEGSRAKNVAVQLMRVQEKLSAAAAHAVITVNPWAKDCLIETGVSPSKVTVIRNMPDPKVFDRSRYGNEREKGQKFTLIYPGTIKPYYGLEIAVRALPLLATKIPQLCLVIIGPESDHVQELVSLAEQLGVSLFVQFKPAIPIDQVPLHLAQADVGIYPAILDPWMNMATPTKVLEYAIMGIPVIASRVKALEDLFTDSAILFFEPGNVDQFAHCVLELFNDRTRREELVKNADMMMARTYSWNVERQTYLNLLNRLRTPGEGLVIPDESSACDC